MLTSAQSASGLFFLALSLSLSLRLSPSPHSNCHCHCLCFFKVQGEPSAGHSMIQLGSSVSSSISRPDRLVGQPVSRPARLVSLSISRLARLVSQSISTQPVGKLASQSENQSVSRPVILSVRYTVASQLVQLPASQPVSLSVVSLVSRPDSQLNDRLTLASTVDQKILFG